jgi:hypothetical protein
MIRKEKTVLYKGKSLPRGEISHLRKKPGMGSAGKYKTLKKSEFAGPKGTYPINDIAHARNALARAHFSPHASAIKAKVYKEYPGLKKRHQERSRGKHA